METELKQSMPDLSIIIVNYLSSHLIVDAIASVYLHTRRTAFEIIVVDNSSDKEGKELILNRYPDVKWIDMGYNAGFSRANNKGMAAASGNVYLLLNPDTLAIDNSIETCYEQLRSSAYVAAGVQLLDEKREPQISGSFFMKGGLNHLLPLPYWGGLLRWIGYQAKTKVPNVQKAKSMEDIESINLLFTAACRNEVGYE